MSDLENSRVQIRPAEADDMDAVREIFREYADWLQVDYCLKDFEAELAGLPGAFAAPAGGLWLAWVDGALAGCVGFRPLEGGAIGDAGAGDCEMRRLWVRDAFRGAGLGRGLAETALRAAEAAGYRRMVLETLGFMDAARALYGDLGFRAEARDYKGLDDDLHYMVCDLAGTQAASA